MEALLLQCLPDRQRLTLVQFRRDKADFLAPAQMLANDPRRWPGSIIETIQPDSCRLPIKHRYRLHIAVTRVEAELPLSKINHLRHRHIKQEIVGDMILIQQIRQQVPQAIGLDIYGKCISISISSQISNNVLGRRTGKSCHVM